MVLLMLPQMMQKKRFSSAGALPCYFSFVAPLSLQFSIHHSNPTWPPALIRALSKLCNGDLLDCKTFFVHCGLACCLREHLFPGSGEWYHTDCLVTLSSAFLSCSTHSWSLWEWEVEIQSWSQLMWIQWAVLHMAQGTWRMMSTSDCIN